MLPAAAVAAAPPPTAPISACRGWLKQRLCGEVLSLPIFPELSEAQQQRVIEVLGKLAGACSGAMPAAQPEGAAVAA